DLRPTVADAVDAVVERVEGLLLRRRQPTHDHEGLGQLVELLFLPRVPELWAAEPVARAVGDDGSEKCLPQGNARRMQTAFLVSPSQASPRFQVETVGGGGHPKKCVGDDSTGPQDSRPRKIRDRLGSSGGLKDAYPSHIRPSLKIG